MRFSLARSQSKALSPEKSTEKLELGEEVKGLQGGSEKLKNRVKELSSPGTLMRGVVADAYLYISKRRDDEWVFVKLYGLTSWEIGMPYTKNVNSAINILNVWSKRVRENGGEAFSEELKHVYYKYIEILRNYINAETKGTCLMELHEAGFKFWEIAKMFS